MGFVVEVEKGGHWTQTHRQSPARMASVFNGGCFLHQRQLFHLQTTSQLFRDLNLRPHFPHRVLLSADCLSPFLAILQRLQIMTVDFRTEAGRQEE